MWNATDYEAYNGSSQAGGFLMSPSSQTVGGKSENKSKRINSLVPCTCAELTAAVSNDDTFKSPCGITISQVSIVGQIKRANVTPIRYDYTIDDSTGRPFDVKQFLDTESGTSVVPFFEEGTYVRAYGHLRALGGERCMAAFKVAKIEDMDELSYHLLNVVWSRVRLLGAGLGTTVPSRPAAAIPGMVDPSFMGMNQVEQQVLAMIKANITSEGITFRELKDSLRGVPEKRIRDVLDFLSNEGHVYSSIDEDHFKSTDS